MNERCIITLTAIIQVTVRLFAYGEKVCNLSKLQTMQLSIINYMNLYWGSTHIKHTH
jgi:hypothetical protein